MRPDPATLARIAQIAADLREEMAGDDDAQAFIDTLDGETEALDLLDALIARAQDDADAAEACKSREARVKVRRAAHEARASVVRDSIGRVLDAMGEKTVRRPLATVSRGKGRVSVHYTDRDAVPTQLRKLGPPDGTAIRKALEDGADVPGAELRQGDPTVSIREV